MSLKSVPPMSQYQWSTTVERVVGEWQTHRTSDSRCNIKRLRHLAYLSNFAQITDLTARFSAFLSSSLHRSWVTFLKKYEYGLIDEWCMFVVLKQCCQAYDANLSIQIRQRNRKNYESQRKNLNLNKHVQIKSNFRIIRMIKVEWTSALCPGVEYTLWVGLSFAVFQ